MSMIINVSIKVTLCSNIQHDVIMSGLKLVEYYLRLKSDMRKTEAALLDNL